MQHVRHLGVCLDTLLEPPLPRRPSLRYFRCSLPTFITTISSFLAGGKKEGVGGVVGSEGGRGGSVGG